MAITTFDSIIAARTGGNYWDWFDGLTANVTPIAGAWYNLTARVAQTGRNVLTYGTYVNSGANGAIMNAATTGAIPIPYSGASARYLTSLGAMVPSISGFSALMLIDMLWSSGPIDFSVVKGTTVTPTSTSPTLTNNLALGVSSGLPTLYENIYSGSSYTKQYGLKEVYTDSESRLAFGYKASDIAINANNGETLNILDVTSIPSTINQLNISNQWSPFNGTIKRITYYPFRVTDTELQELSKK